MSRNKSLPADLASRYSIQLMLDLDDAGWAMLAPYLTEYQLPDRTAVYDRTEIASIAIRARNAKARRRSPRLFGQAVV